MKILIILNCIIPLCAAIQSIRALIISYRLDLYFRTRDVRYLMAEDKVAYEKAVRIYLYLVLSSNLILLSWNLNRAILGFIPYASDYIAATSILFSLILFLKAQFILSLSKGNGIINKIKNLKI